MIGTSVITAARCVSLNRSLIAVCQAETMSCCNTLENIRYRRRLAIEPGAMCGRSAALLSNVCSRAWPEPGLDEMAKDCQQVTATRLATAAVTCWLVKRP